MSDKKQIWEVYRNTLTCVICAKKFVNKNRDHCPHCLCSIHLDIEPRDNESDCRGVLRPVSRTDKEIVHKCERCGTIQYNPIYIDDDLTILK